MKQVHSPIFKRDYDVGEFYVSRDVHCPIDKTPLVSPVAIPGAGSTSVCRACGAQYDDLTPEAMETTARHYAETMRDRAARLRLELSALEAIIYAARMGSILEQ